MAYAKLREGILAIVNLDAPDAETLQVWLSSRFDGPIGEQTIVPQVALSVLTEVREFDDCAYPDDDSDWDATIAALV
jgi:hypothetical protein